MKLRSRTARAGPWVALSILFVALAWTNAATPAAQPNDGGPKTTSALQDMAWVRVSYAQLLDESTVVRTGQLLTSAVRDPAQRGSVQPFIDQYTYLLQHTVEMLKGPDPLPYTSVTDYYQPGASQPAWVAIFRGGRIHAVADGRDHVRLFLQGEDPDTAYAQHYSIVRHCLNALTPRDGRPLQVEVYAYQHDYAASEMRLDTRPSRLSSTSFPAKTKELDLAGLSKFFAQGATLEGAQLSRTEGLVLYGQRGERPTLSGQPVSLADLTVAYRAAFHAGDNAAFVSLDEHADPTRVTVNYGGFLENTRIGSVVLEADKRLKTITSGIDPNTHEDLRDRTRQRIPSFLSAAERDLASSDSRSASGWAATRLWFYPDQAGVETDPDFQFAAITHPQFTADAERSRKRFVAPGGSDPGAGLLSPGIRESMNHLNTRYAEYANAFPELREFSNVARLMAIASWLKRADPDWLDLDALLAVELPAHSTEQERTSLLVATVLSSPALESGSPKGAGARLFYFTPIFDRTVKDYFKTPEQLARYLATRDGASAEMSAAYAMQAGDIMAKQGTAEVRSLVRTRSDLRALADYALAAQDAGSASSQGALSKEIESSENALDKLQSEIAVVKSQSSRASGSTYNELVDKHNALVKQYSEELARHRERVAAYNAAQVQTRSTMEIAGGVDLDPRSFQILTPAQSARLAELQALARQAGDAGASSWLRSQAAKMPLPPAVAALPATDWLVKLGKGGDEAALTYAQARAGDAAWGLLQNPDGSWRATLQQAASQYSDISFQPGQGKFSFTKLVSGRVVAHLIGGVPAAGLIVFEHPKVREVLKPIIKPLKWLQDRF